MSKFIKTVLLIGMLVLAAGCASEESLIEPPSESTLGEQIYEQSSALNKNLNRSTQTESIAISDTLIFSDALAKALVESPALQSSAWQVRVKEAERIQASLLPNPELEAEMENFGGTGPFEGYDSRETTIRLSQKILLGADRMKRKRVAGLDRNLAGWDYETKRLDILTGVTKAYISALEAQEHLEQQKELLEVAEQFYNSVVAQVKAGKVSQLEATKANVELSKVRIELRRIQQKQSSAFAALAAFWGSRRPEFTWLEGSLDTAESIPELTGITQYVERNADIARWATEIQRLEANVSYQRAKGIPDIKLGAGYRRMEDLDAEAALVSVSIPLPFFNRNQGNVKAARYQLNQAETQREGVFADVYRNLSQSYHQLNASYYEVQQLESEVIPGAEEAYEAAQIGYRQGKFDFLEVLDAQRTLFTSRTRYIESLAEFNKAIADVERLIGTSLEDISTN